MPNCANYLIDLKRAVIRGMRGAKVRGVVGPTNAFTVRDGHCRNHGRLPARDPIYR